MYTTCQPRPKPSPVRSGFGNKDKATLSSPAEPPEISKAKGLVIAQVSCVLHLRHFPPHDSATMVPVSFFKA